MKTKWIIIWIWGLVVFGACVQVQKGIVIHKRPVEGLSGYDVFVREAQEPEKIVYGVPDAQTPKENEDETKTDKVSIESSSTPIPPDSQSLRRERIPLRRNRYILLNQASLD